MARQNQEDGLPALSSDEDQIAQEGFRIRDHDLDGGSHQTSKLSSIRSIDLIREFLEWCQVEPRSVLVSWEQYKNNIYVKCEEISALSQEFMSHRLGVQNKDQTAIYNQTELNEVYRAMLYKKQAV